MIIRVKPTQKLRVDAEVIPNIPPGENNGFSVVGGNVYPHPFHGPDTRHAKGSEGGKKVFLIDGYAVGLRIVIWGAEESETDLAVEHPDAEDGAEADA
jgi:hypothetical protein